MNTSIFKSPALCSFCPNFLFDWHFHIMKSVVRSDDIKVPTTILWFLAIVPIWWHSTNKITTRRKKNQHKICIKSDYYSNDDRNISKNISNIECLPGTIYELLLRAKYKIYKIKPNNNNENWSKPREKVCLIGKKLVDCQHLTYNEIYCCTTNCIHLTGLIVFLCVDMIPAFKARKNNLKIKLECNKYLE